jgi:hypothetical protein
MVVTYNDWYEMLSYALHKYQTIVKTSTGSTPYFLVYGMKMIIPLKMRIFSLKVLTKLELEQSE